MPDPALAASALREMLDADHSDLEGVIADLEAAAAYRNKKAGYPTRWSSAERKAVNLLRALASAAEAERSADGSADEGA